MGSFGSCVSAQLATAAGLLLLRFYCRLDHIGLDLWTGPDERLITVKHDPCPTANSPERAKNIAYASNASSRNTLGIEGQHLKYDDGTSGAAARTDRGGGENAGSRAA